MKKYGQAEFAEAVISAFVTKICEKYKELLDAEKEKQVMDKSLKDEHNTFVSSRECA